MTTGDLPDRAVPHTVDTHLGNDALTVLARHWPALYAHDREATPFQSPAYLTAAARQLPAAATPLVLAARTSGGRIVAALALARHRDRSHARGKVRIRALCISPAAHLRLAGPHAEDDAVARAFALHLLLWHETGIDLALAEPHADTALGRAVREVLPDRLTTNATPPAVLALPFHFEALAPSRQREHARRCRHWAHLAATHTVTYQRSHHQQALLAGLDVLTALQKLGPDAAAPWRALAPAIGASGAFVADLHVDGAPIAAQLCLTRGRRCYSAAQAAHPGYRHLAPAHALLRHLLDDLAQEGFHTLDPGRGTRGAASTAPGPPIRLAA
ncbi:GNAT family N-acetyltransferase [Streptomyces sp. MMBL 11-3]|uniref:GNAT family N-acetyltransferase n=1 Tax=Streptomyces sp. MMBL 11-3 TaxID=3382639 RepID=UPI0039B6E90B